MTQASWRPMRNSSIAWIVCAVSLGGLLFGFDAGVISGCEKAIQAEFDLRPFWHGLVVACALIVYGVLFILVERFHRGKENDVATVDDISYRQAALIGVFQAIAIVPGTSRSGSTILGSRLIGISRPAAAEFSFFLGIPAMAGASALKGLGFLDYVLESGVHVPAVACVSAFVVSMVVIRFLMDFVKRHSFAPFGVYRIVLGALVILWFALGI